jgi:hypothetical protein
MPEICQEQQVLSQEVASPFEISLFVMSSSSELKLPEAKTMTFQDLVTDPSFFLREDVTRSSSMLFVHVMSVMKQKI